jgi:hypothetical protein
VCCDLQYSHVSLTLKGGASCTLINARVAPSYDHRLDVYCEEGVVRVANPDETAVGVAFSGRFAESYHGQMADFITEARAVAKGATPTPNVDLARTMWLDRLVKACHQSVANGGEVVELSAGPQAERPTGVSSPPREPTPEPAKEPSLRTYDDTTAERVKELYCTSARAPPRPPFRPPLARPSASAQSVGRAG